MKNMNIHFLHILKNCPQIPVFHILHERKQFIDCFIDLFTVHEALIDNIKAKVLLADRGYDSDAIVEKAEKAGMKAVIPPRKNRKTQREYDKELYKLRHFVENAFMILKRWRGVATRYAKNTASFLAAVQIRCIAAWVF